MNGVVDKDAFINELWEVYQCKDNHNVYGIRVVGTDTLDWPSFGGDSVDSTSRKERYHYMREEVARYIVYVHNDVVKRTKLAKILPTGYDLPVINGDPDQPHVIPRDYRDHVAVKWEVKRCPDAPPWAACEITITNSDRLHAGYEVFAGDDPCTCNHVLLRIDAEHIVDLHNGMLDKRDAAMVTPVYDAPLEHVPPSISDEVKIEACARVVNDVANAAGVVGVWPSEPWDAQPEWVRAGLRTMVAAILSGDPGGIVDYRKAGLLSATVASVSAAIPAVVAAAMLPPLQVTAVREPDAPTETDMRRDIDELMVRALKYDDKPHHLYSYIMVMARRYASEGTVDEICRIMDAEYERDRSSGHTEAVR